MGSELEQQPAAERCRCGYLLKGLTEKRCPECGRPIPSGARRKWPLLRSGFLWGFGILAVPSIAVLCIAAFFIPGGAGFCGMWQAFVFIAGLIGLAIAVVTGLIGMLIGYGIYRRR